MTSTPTLTRKRLGRCGVSEEGRLRRAETIPEGEMPLTFFHLQAGLHRKQRSLESIDDQAEPPPPGSLTRRKALVPQPNKQVFDETEKPEETGMKNNENGNGTSPTDNVIIVPHLQLAPGDNHHLYNRAITNRGGLLNELQKATTAAQAFYAESDGAAKKPKSPWLFKRLYEWSHRAKAREIVRHANKALDKNDKEYQDEELTNLLEQPLWYNYHRPEGELPDKEDKRLQAVWELFHSELTFLVNHLLVLRNVYKEPLKECQVEGCLLFVEPDLLFGNLEELCQVSYSFCKTFLKLLERSKSSNYASTEILVNLFDKFAKGPSTIAAYQAYCINYKATMEYLEFVRKTDERFVEFEKLCVHDKRCQRLQLADLLIAPLHRITRLPILLKEIRKYTLRDPEREQVDEIIEGMTDSLRSIDDSIQWLHNFERLQELQVQLIWPSIFDLEPKVFVPEFLKLALSRQFCENLVAHPRRLLIHEGILYCHENQKQTETYAFLFNDMLLLTKFKRATQKGKKMPASSGTGPKCNDRFIVVRQPVPLDCCVFCDVGPQDASALNLKNAFVILHLTRFYQVVAVYTLQAPTKDSKDYWIQKFQESIERYESIQLKDMLKCTPLLSGSLRNSQRRGRSPLTPRQSFSPSPSPIPFAAALGRSTSPVSGRSPPDVLDSPATHPKSASSSPVGWGEGSTLRATNSQPYGDRDRNSMQTPLRHTLSSGRLSPVSPTKNNPQQYTFTLIPPSTVTL